MTGEQYEKIKKFKPQFELAKTNFCRVSRGDLETLREVYNDIYSKSLGKANMNCNACVIRMMKALGEAVEKYEVYLSRFGKKKSEANSNEEAQEPAE